MISSYATIQKKKLHQDFILYERFGYAKGTGSLNKLRSLQFDFGPIWARCRYTHFASATRPM